MKPRSDEELMLEFKRGNRRAFEDLFARYKNSVYGYVRRRVDDPGRAEEIAQDVFLALVQRRNGYEVQASFRTYLYRIAMNRVITEYRRKKEHESLFEEQVPANGPDPAAVQQVREALAQLDREQREIVMLREYEGLSYEEIAHILKIPMGTVRSRLFRAKLALRELLAPTWVRESVRT